jgi:hypothetical protein
MRRCATRDDRIGDATGRTTDDGESHRRVAGCMWCQRQPRQSRPCALSTAAACGGGQARQHPTGVTGATTSAERSSPSSIRARASERHQSGRAAHWASLDARLRANHHAAAEHAQHAQSDRGQLPERVRVEPDHVAVGRELPVAAGEEDAVEQLERDVEGEEGDDSEYGYPHRQPCPAARNRPPAPRVSRDG